MSKPGPVMMYRISSFFLRKKLKPISKVIDYMNRLLFGCWMPGTCVVGKDLVLGYWGMSIVIHKSCRLGDNVHIDQCVTLGGNGTEEGVPQVGSNVYIGAGAKVLGPITIGSGVVIGANSVVTKSVDENCVVAGIPARVLKKDIQISEFLHHLKESKA